MKDYLIIIVLVLGASLLYGQSKDIKLLEYQLSGYIFEKEYQPNFNIDQIEDRFTPTIEDIRVAESLLESFDLKSRKSKKYNRRQYIGYIKQNTKYLLIHTMYYKCEKIFNQDYPSWGATFAYLFSEPDELQKSNLYFVNLDDRTIGYFTN